MTIARITTRLNLIVMVLKRNQRPRPIMEAYYDIPMEFERGTMHEKRIVQCYHYGNMGDVAWNEVRLTIEHYKYGR